MTQANEHIIKAKWLNTSTDPSIRNIGLDIIRALCLILVVATHSNNLLGKYLPVYKVIFPMGTWAQEVFFSLSGLLIGNQLLKFINKDFKPRRLFVFYSKRWIRTIPFYFLFLGINYFMYVMWYKNSGLNLFSADFDLAPYFTFAQNLFERHPVFYPEIWPIPIEEWSYLLIPVPLILVICVFTEAPYMAFLSVIIILIVTITIFRMNYVLEFNPEQDWGLRKIVLYRLDALLYGVALAILLKMKESFFIKHKTFLLVIGAITSITIAFMGIILKDKHMNGILFTALPLFSALILPFFRYTVFKSSRITALFTHFSLVSYAALLSHLYFLQFMLINAFRPSDLPAALGVTVLYLLLLGIFSTFFYNFVERPVLLLRKQS